MKRSRYFLYFLMVMSLWISPVTAQIQQVVQQEEQNQGESENPEALRRGDPNFKASDNTANNIVDRTGNNLTPTDQSESKQDLDLTQRIRQAVIEDRNLSLLAKNVKIISQNGRVTLRGPVKNEEEKKLIGTKAAKIAGVEQVENKLQVKA